MILIAYIDRPSDRRFWAKLVPTLADRGCCMVSTTKLHGHDQTTDYQNVAVIIILAQSLQKQIA
jgi:hypothetical protein